jgi:hypothetical protein
MRRVGRRKRDRTETRGLGRYVEPELQHPVCRQVVAGPRSMDGEGLERTREPAARVEVHDRDRLMGVCVTAWQNETPVDLAQVGAVDKVGAGRSGRSRAA